MVLRVSVRRNNRLNDDKFVALKKRKWIDEMKMEEEEGKRQKEVVGSCIYRKRKEVVSSGHKPQIDGELPGQSAFLSIPSSILCSPR
jgi:hypothetical protein